MREKRTFLLKEKQGSLIQVGKFVEEDIKSPIKRVIGFDTSSSLRFISNKGVCLFHVSISSRFVDYVVVSADGVRF